MPRPDTLRAGRLFLLVGSPLATLASPAVKPSLTPIIPAITLGQSAVLRKHFREYATIEFNLYCQSIE